MPNRPLTPSHYPNDSVYLYAMLIQTIIGIIQLFVYYVDSNPHNDVVYLHDGAENVTPCVITHFFIAVEAIPCVFYTTYVVVVPGIEIAVDLNIFHWQRLQMC